MRRGIFGIYSRPLSKQKSDDRLAVGVRLLGEFAQFRPESFIRPLVHQTKINSIPQFADSPDFEEAMVGEDAGYSWSNASGHPPLTLGLAKRSTNLLSRSHDR
ncbi:MAG: hypothetical protein ACRCYU_24180 [Nocardioides sp.]